MVTIKEKSSGVVIFRKDSSAKIYYLLLNYQQGHWDFPKGHIEKGETEEAAAKREVEEETGIKELVIIRGFREFIKWFFKRTYDLKKEEKNKAPLIFKTAVFFLAETKAEEIKISSEHTGYKWMQFDDALKQLTFKNAKNILQKSNEFIVKNGL